jgi:hypothetical protein
MIMIQSDIFHRYNNNHLYNNNNINHRIYNKIIKYLVILCHRVMPQ